MGSGAVGRAGGRGGGGGGGGAGLDGRWSERTVSMCALSGRLCSFSGPPGSGVVSDQVHARLYHMHGRKAVCNVRLAQCMAIPCASHVGRCSYLARSVFLCAAESVRNNLLFQDIPAGRHIDAIYIIVCDVCFVLQLLSLLACLWCIKSSNMKCFLWTYMYVGIRDGVGIDCLS